MSDLPYYFRSRGMRPVHVWRVWAMNEGNLIFSPDDPDEGITLTFSATETPDCGRLLLYKNKHLGLVFTEDAIENMAYFDTIAPYIDFYPTPEQLQAMGLETTGEKPLKFSGELPYISESSKLQAFQKFQRKLQALTETQADVPCDFMDLATMYFEEMSKTNYSMYEAFWKQLGSKNEALKFKEMFIMRVNVLYKEKKAFDDYKEKVQKQYPGDTVKQNEKIRAFFNSQIWPGNEEEIMEGAKEVYFGKLTPDVKDTAGIWEQIRSYVPLLNSVDEDSTEYKKKLEEFTPVPATELQLQCLADLYKTNVCIAVTPNNGEFTVEFIQGKNSETTIYLERSNSTHYDLLLEAAPGEEKQTLLEHIQTSFNDVATSVLSIPGRVKAYVYQGIGNTLTNIGRSFSTASRFIDRTAL